MPSTFLFAVSVYKRTLSLQPQLPSTQYTSHCHSRPGGFGTLLRSPLNSLYIYVRAVVVIIIIIFIIIIFNFSNLRTPLPFPGLLPDALPQPHHQLGLSLLAPGPELQPSQHHTRPLRHQVGHLGPGTRQEGNFSVC